MDQSEETKKQKAGRGGSYPSVPLDTAINDIQKLRKNLGSGPYSSREEIAKGLDYSSLSGASQSRIAALVHYGLIDGRGESYAQSLIASRILFPKSDEDKSSALREAVLLPKIFGAIYKKYQGEELPAKLANILIHDFGVSDVGADSLVKNFKISFEYVGLLQNGMLVTSNAQNDLNSPINTSLIQNQDSQTNQRTSQNLLYSDSMEGEGWKLTLLTNKPVSIGTRKKILEIIENLETEKN
jgi:hypothetical protein